MTQYYVTLYHMISASDFFEAVCLDGGTIVSKK